MATHLYHIAQEAVNNAIKHGRSRPDRALAATGKTGSGILMVEDDGVGLPDSARPSTPGWACAS